jgi:phosphonate transport system substrate-binding protein
MIVLLCAASGCYKPKAQSHPLGSAENPIVMYFVPSHEAESVTTTADGLAALLDAQTGLHFKASTATSYVGIVEAMGAGQVQVGWLPPVAYIFAHQRNGDEALLKVIRHGKPTYRGQIMVRSGSPYKSVADLKGRRIAFPEQTSASGYYYPAALLKAAGVDPENDIEPRFSGGHDAALLMLVHGEADAACGFEDIRTRVEAVVPDVMAKVRVLAYTPEIPADNVCVSKSLPAELRQKVLDGLLAMAGTDQGKALLKELYDIDGLAPATDSDYEPVRQMMNALGQDPEAELKKADAQRAPKPAAPAPPATPPAAGH